MSKCLLHKKTLGEFIIWLDAQGIAYRAPRGEWQVLQVQTSKTRNQWHCVFDRLDAPEHYTVAHPLEAIVTRFTRYRQELRKQRLAANPLPVQGKHNEADPCTTE